MRLLSAITVLFNTGCGNSHHEEENGAVADSAATTHVLNRSTRPIGLCTADLPRKQRYVTDSVVNTALFAREKSNTEFRSMQRSYAVGMPRLYWRKRKINVVFMGGDPEVRRRVIATARKWEHITSVKFNFDQHTNDTDIAISFIPGIGTQSAIGQECKLGFPSMNFDDLYPDDDSRFYDYYVLHEFGHALGLEHEHQSYNCNVVWNIPALFNYCNATFDPKWDSAKIYHNIINRFSFEMAKATSYDPQSIMMYTFPDSIVTSGYIPQQPNYRISPRDSIFLRKEYALLH